MKKKTLIIVIALVAAAIAGTTIFFATKSGNKGTKVGFYNIPEEIAQVYKEIITKENKSQIEFITLTEEDIKKDRNIKKLSMIITYNNALTQRLKPEAEPVPQDIMERFPRTIRESELYNYENTPKIFPISLDMFETMVLTTAVNYYNLPVPETVTDIMAFGKKAKETYPFPIIISGAQDIIANSFFTQLVESFGGKTGYQNIKKQLEEDKNLENFYNYKVKDTITVKTILDLIKTWEKEEILSRNWHTTKPESTSRFIEDNRVSMALMTLSEHRKITSSNLNYYETIIFPPAETSGPDRLSIQPAIVGMILKASPETKIITSRLTTVENQELISLQTQLGPVTLQGTSFDRQADDARFFAASFPGGPVPDLATLVFEDSQTRHKMAELIRNYK